jgi:hypothetical protein
MESAPIIAELAASSGGKWGLTACLRSADIRRQYGLLVKDSLVVAAALGACVGSLAFSGCRFSAGSRN